MPQLILWDIDHTLIDTRGVGRQLSAAAFEEATGHPMRQQAKIDGITEAVIFREAAKLHGFTSDRSDFERFAAALTAQHAQRARKLGEQGHALPGAASALDALAAAGLRQTVVTGNVRAVAEIKLKLFGLDRHIQWDGGAYGEDADLRPTLVELALARSSVPAEDTVLTGDMPADVEGSLATGVRVIAVATGRSSPEELSEAGAHAVVRDLTDSECLVTLVTKSSL